MPVDSIADTVAWQKLKLRSPAGEETKGTQVERQKVHRETGGQLTY